MVAPPKSSRKGRRGKVLSLVIAVVVVAGLGAAAYGLSRVTQAKVPGSADQAPVTNGPTPGSQPAPTPSLPTPTLAVPFLGTPAASFANGAAGIVIPAAHPVGRFSAAQVAAAYRKTKRMLLAANLNGPTLRGGSPDAFAHLLIPQQRGYFTGRLDKIGLTSAGFQRSTRTWVTSFAPGSTQLDGKVIKVHGTMHAETGRNGSWHVLQVHADYLFVYAVERPGQPGTLMRLVGRDVVDVQFAPYTGPGGPLEPWWKPKGGGVAGARCDVADGFVHPQFPNGPPDKVKPTGAPINPYNQSAPPASNGKCQATTGT